MRQIFPLAMQKGGGFNGYETQISEALMSTAFFIYAVCFVVGLVYTIFSAFLGHIFGEHEVAGDVGSGGQAEGGLNTSDMPGISIFSPTTVATFVTALGGFGMIFSSIEMTSPIWISAPLSAICAFMIAAVVFSMFAWLFQKVQGSSESRVGTLLGQPATIVAPIPANGVGEIAYVQFGTRYTAPAREDKGAAVPTGQSVKIVRIVGTQFYVHSD
jgi:membrane protein implicated in regulation of membrane protease activity